MNPHARNVNIALGTLFASSATLLCCVLPAVLVALGAGATLVSLVSAFPQLVWLSERKGFIFSLAAFALLTGGILIWRARSEACPTDRDAARVCARLRRAGVAIYGFALLAFLLGATFAFLLPAI